MSDGITTTIAGEAVVMLGERALYWPARARLLLADLHLGKADTFRRAGIALPHGGTAHDLDRLSSLIADNDARSVWVLGDLLHGALIDTHWRGSWDVWRSRHAGVEVAVVTGNHDRALRRAGLDIELLGERVDDGPFALRHAPDAQADRHVLCGHLHPVVSLPAMQRRWPVFWLREGCTVLPAFSRFTGGVLVAPAPRESLVACVEGDAIALPAATGA